MQYVREVMDLMAAFPGREFKMAGLVRYATGDKALDLKARRAARKAAMRVIKALVETGTVTVRPAGPRGGGANYSWKAEACDERIPA